MTSWPNLIRYVIELDVEITYITVKLQQNVSVCVFDLFLTTRTCEKNVKIARLSLNADHSELLMLENF